MGNQGHDAPELGGPDDDETLELFRRLRRTEDRELRNELVERFMPVAKRLASRWARSSRSPDDVIQVANFALVKAVDRFDPDRGIGFIGFAAPTVLGELRRYFRDTSPDIRLPRALGERVQGIETRSRQLTSELGRPPSAQELATALEVSLEEALEAIEAAQSQNTLSLDTPQSFAGGDDSTTTFRERLGREDVNIELAEWRATLAKTLPHVRLEDREVLELRFGQNLTQSEIAERVGVSQMQVSRMLQRAIQELRRLTEVDDGSV